MNAAGRLGRAVLALAVLLALVIALSGAPASAGGDPAELLRRAREAANEAVLAGIVEVRWRDGDDLHVERTGARSRQGTVVVGRGEHVAVGAQGARWAADDGVATRWGHVESAPPPGPGSSWDLELDDPARVAGRDAHVIIARDDEGRERARFFVDMENGLLLRRDVVDDDGTLERSVRYARLTADGVSPAVPPVPDRGKGPVVTDDVGARFVAPTRLEPGFELLGRYRHPDGTVQLFYADGLFSLSIFQQPGLVDWDALPPGGRRVFVDGERGSAYSTPAGTVVVWELDDLVVTGVSDAPSDVAQEAIAALDGDDGGPLADVVDYVLGPFGWE